MGRGFSSNTETSEFVTKRTCFSFLIAISFLCLLIGFLLGRLVSDRTIAMREQKALSDLGGNGLVAAGHIKEALMHRLNATLFHLNYTEDDSIITLNKQNVSEIKSFLSDLQMFRLRNVKEPQSNCTMAAIGGSQEKDRYVVLSVNGDGINIALNIASTLEYLYNHKDWEPKRTIIFCIFLGSKDVCSEQFIDRVKPKIAAYIAIHGDAAKGDKDILVSGSGMVQATLMDAINDVNEYYGEFFEGVLTPNSLPQLNLNIPYANVSFVVNSSAEYNATVAEYNQRILAQIVGVSIWTLSEEIFFQWDPKYFSEIMNNSLNSITSENLKASKDELNQTVAQLINSTMKFNELLKNVHLLKTLEVRIMNDLLIDLDRALLCSDSSLNTHTNFAIFQTHNSIQYFNQTLQSIQNCFKAANDILNDPAFCQNIFKMKMTESESNDHND